MMDNKSESEKLNRAGDAKIVDNVGYNPSSLKTKEKGQPLGDLFDPIPADDTLEKLQQNIKFQIYTVDPLVLQMTLDRIPKPLVGAPTRPSAPVAYYRMSTADQFIRLGCDSFALAVALSFVSRNQVSIDDIRATVRSTLDMFFSDIAKKVQHAYYEVKRLEGEQ